jgi:type IV pilus assembly protein PilX
MRLTPAAFQHTPRKQSGVVLLIALIMLVAMTLAGMAMLRSLGAGAGIAGNLAFKQNATAVADLGVEVARTWLLDKGTNAILDLNADSAPALGYFSCWYGDCAAKTEFNPLTHNWANSRKLTSTEASFISGAGRDNTGNEIRYVLHRLCDIPGAVEVEKNALQKCANFTQKKSPDKGAISVGGGALILSQQPYFRVTVRVTGPRNTLSYIQVVMY